MTSKRAFTLTELLVVLAVIAILAALLLPVLSSAKAKAMRTTCMNNLREVNRGLRMYTDDFSDWSPSTPATNRSPSMQNMIAFTGFTKLIQPHVGLEATSTSNDRIFSCPADRFYYDLRLGGVGHVGRGFRYESFTDHSSYGFNAGTTNPVLAMNTPGLAGKKVSSVKEPGKTILVAELSSLFPWSWHEPKKPLSVENAVFNNAKNMLSFVDGHVNYSKIFWNSNRIESGGVLYVRNAADFDPPAGYDYKWSPD
jgi:prepilin-type N-terminal cleavage/methylation domain-containing protein